MKQDVVDINGKVIESLDLPKELFALEEQKVLVSQVIKAYRANERQGNANTKSRGEVQGSTKKLYRQKGTGRARVGSLRSPTRVGGGIAFGPKTHGFKEGVTQKMKQKALFMVLSGKVKEAKLKIIDGIEKCEQKTKKAQEMLNNIFPEARKKDKILFVMNAKMDKTEKIIRNIGNVNYQVVSTLNTENILTHTYLLITKDAVQKLIETGKKTKKSKERKIPTKK
jgi:large subunit ribosomal protein L4